MGTKIVSIAIIVTFGWTNLASAEEARASEPLSSVELILELNREIILAKDVNCVDAGLGFGSDFGDIFTGQHRLILAEAKPDCVAFERSRDQYISLGEGAHDSLLQVLSKEIAGPKHIAYVKAQAALELLKGISTFKIRDGDGG